jgi:hypothetical protein
MVRRDFHFRAGQHGNHRAEREPDSGRAARAHHDYATSMGGAGDGERRNAEEAAKSLHN